MSVAIAYEGFYKGEQPTDFVHPGCGGSIRLKGQDLRIAPAFSATKIYSQDGEFLREELLHSKRNMN